MKDQLVCTTFYKPGMNQLLIGGAVALEAVTEIELAQKAKEMGINLRELDNSTPIGDDSCFFVQWYGSRSQVDYLKWKGAIGVGEKLRRAIKAAKEHNDNR